MCLWQALEAGAAIMGISQITNLSQLPQTISISSGLEPPPMARVENSARTGDDTYSSSNSKSAGGSEDDGSEDEVVDQPDEAEPDSSTQPPAESSQNNFFA
jgi:hypothetical protein